MYIQTQGQPNLSQQGFPIPLAHEVYSIKEVAQIVKAGRSTIYHWMKNGLFPRPRKCGVRMVRWRAEDVFRWLAEREMA